MSRKIPFPINTPSGLFSRLEEKLSRLMDCDGECFFSLLDLMMAHDQRLYLFGRTDSHCTINGTVVILKKCLSVLFGHSAITDLGLFSGSLLSEQRKVVIGSFQKYFPDILINDLAPDLNCRVERELGIPAIVKQTSPAPGRHIGSTIVFKNPLAPLKNCAIAFGNSFFDLGKTPEGLSWWFARLFSEFHFVWSPGLDLKYVDKVGPDFVICQTIERSLHVVPKY